MTSHRAGPSRPRNSRALPGRGGAFARPATVTGLLALVTLAGCAHAPATPPPVPPAAATARPAPPPAPARPRPRPGYAGRVDSLDSVDASILRGRRIVLDPGHGGYFTGCIGVGGTTEAEVNLGVGLRLRTLLVAAGALVAMTRESDRDFLSPADSSLKHDLAERVTLANAFRPDLFLSIHHNADAGGAHDVNETQTYFQLGDDGPSPDAASDVHRSLVRNLGIETQKLLPGNFAVVRGSEAPALLTEASYLTDPDVEALLRTPRAQQLEAEALYLGLARFFARRSPVVESFGPAGAIADTSAPRFATGRPRLRALIGGAFDEAQVRFDGGLALVTRTGRRLDAVPRAPLASGMHEAAVRVRLASEGSSRERRLRFEIRKPATALALDAPAQGDWSGRVPLALRVRATDADGLALRDSLKIRLNLRLPRGVLPADTTVVLREGEAWGYFHATRPLRAATLVAGAALRGRTPKPVTTSRAIVIRSGPVRTLAGFALRMPDGDALTEAPGLAGNESEDAWLNRDGFAVLPCDSLGLARAPALGGFRTWGADSAWPVRYVALAGGALHGRRFVLDPEGGGDDAAGMGPSGTRAATLNLEVARALGAMLEAAGAQVMLTRERDAALSEVERVQIAEKFHAERYLRIGHAAAPPIAGHYFASAGGRRWAQRIAAACSLLGLADSLPVGEAAKYPLTQTSSIAVYASLHRIDSAAGEAGLLAPGALRAEAYALFAGTAADLAGAAWPADSLRIMAADAPVPGALVTLGGALVVQSDARGVVRFLRTEAGPLEVMVDDSRVRARALLLDLERGRVLTGAR